MASVFTRQETFLHVPTDDSVSWFGPDSAVEPVANVTVMATGSRTNPPLRFDGVNETLADGATDSRRRPFGGMTVPRADGR